jgi:hypothetical protein
VKALQVASKNMRSAVGALEQFANREASTSSNQPLACDRFDQ